MPLAPETSELGTISDVVSMAQRRFGDDLRVVRAAMALVGVIARGARIRLSTSCELAQALRDEFPDKHYVWNHVVLRKDAAA